MTIQVFLSLTYFAIYCESSLKNTKKIRGNIHAVWLAFFVKKTRSSNSFSEASFNVRVEKGTFFTLFKIVIQKPLIF